MRHWRYYRNSFLGLIVPLWNWNSQYIEKASSASWFNRTFMELKLCLNSSRFRPLHGLIVPLWNWNTHVYENVWVFFLFNRTFMELKFFRLKQIRVRTNGLIVPLWNWNYLVRTSTLRALAGLIVPLWNWNDGEGKESITALEV